MTTILSAPQLDFTPKAWELLQTYLRVSNKEITGLGRVKAQNGFLCDDIVIFEQEVTDSTCAIDDEALYLFMEQLIADGKNEAEYRLWWHSHAKLNVFFSGTDVDTMARMTQTYLFSLVGNQKGEVKVRYTQKHNRQAAEPSISIEDIPYNVAWEESDYFVGCREEIEAKVRLFQPAAVSHNGHLPMQLPPPVNGRGAIKRRTRRSRRLPVAANGHRRVPTMEELELLAIDELSEVGQDFAYYSGG